MRRKPNKRDFSHKEARRLTKYVFLKIITKLPKTSNMKRGRQSFLRLSEPYGKKIQFSFRFWAH